MAGFTLRFSVRESPTEISWTKRKLKATSLEEAFQVAENTALEFMTSVHIMRRGSGVVAQVDYSAGRHSTQRRVIQDEE